MCNEGTMISTNRKFFPLLLVLVLAASVAAQTYRGSIRGTITDPNKAVVAGATLSLTNKETGEQRTSITDAAGEYAISSLPPGSYKLEVTAQGFGKFTQDIVLSVNQETRVSPSLEVARVSGDYILDV